MATLERIRNKAGLLVSVVIGLALLAFILGDFLTPGKGVFANTAVEIAEIDGKSIPYTYYQEMIEMRMEAFKTQTGQASLTEQNMVTVRNEAWNDIINEYVIRLEYEGLSLDCSPEELFDMVQGRNIHPQIMTTPIFQDSTGVFDRDRVITFLNNMEQDPRALEAWLNYEKQLQANTIALKFNALIDKGLYVPLKFAEVTYQETLKKVEFQYILKRYTSVPDSTVNFNESEVEEYYNENIDNFKQNATRDIEYVSFDVFASQKDKLAAEEWISNKNKDDFIATENAEQFIRLNSDSDFDYLYYTDAELPNQLVGFMVNANIGEVFGPYLEDDIYKLAKLNDVRNLPDSVKASHILIDPATVGNNPEATRSLADSIKNLIEDGADFAELARLYSADQSNAFTGGDLGWFINSAMVRPFTEACFFAKKGEITTCETSFGIHIIKVVDKGKPGKKYQVATLSRNIEPSQETIDNTFVEASKFASKYAEPDKFQDGLIEEGFAKRVAPNLREGDRNIPSLENPRELVRWAYGTGTFKTKLNDISPIFEFGNRFIVAQLTVIRKDGFAPLEQVRAQIETDLYKGKKAEKIVSEMNISLEKGISLTQLGEEYDVLVNTASEATYTGYSINGIGVEPKLSAGVSIGELNKISEPVDGVAGVYVYMVTGITEAPEGDDFTGERARLMNAILSNGKYRAIEALKERSDIKDYRARY